MHDLNTIKRMNEMRAQGKSRAEIDRALGGPAADVFSSLDTQPVASASVAQVHFGVLRDGTEVAVKVLRPGVERAIARDVALLRTAAVPIVAPPPARFPANDSLLSGQGLSAHVPDPHQDHRAFLQAIDQFEGR